MTPDKETEEKVQHSTTLIPYSYYECRLPEWYANVPMHWHSEFEINYIHRGMGEFICGSQKFTAVEGDILILPPNMLHTAYPCKDNLLNYDAFVFSPVLLGASSNDRCTAECIRPIINGHVQVKVLFSPDSKDYTDIKALTKRIFFCAQENSPRMDLLLKGELMRLFWLLENNGDILFQQDAGTGRNEIIRPVLEYMARNYQNDITVEQLAGLIHLSKSYFMKCFKDTVGVGAIEHLTQLRMNAVCEALSATGDKIADIAFRCGYNNLSNFNRQFLKKVGCSPDEYRKRNRTG
ncbi:MAG: AraC family transcriptional regulator [Blautia sp.]|nr:AraC family transcriptional regulator [Blautia sp.]MCM1199978.1 AraC family transcriptional regulator [Bacteroides fragilis]